MLDRIPDYLFEDQPDLTAQEIEDNLVSRCDAHEETTFMRRLAPEELTERKDQMFTVDVALGDLAEAKKAAMAQFKGQIDPRASQKRQLLQEVRSGQVRETGTLYTLLFPELRQAATYDRFGRRHATRPLTPEERQQSLRLDLGTGRTLPFTGTSD